MKPPTILAVRRMTEKTDWETDFLEMHSKGTRGKLQEKEIQLDVRKKKMRHEGN